VQNEDPAMPRARTGERRTIVTLSSGDDAPETTRSSGDSQRPRTRRRLHAVRVGLQKDPKTLAHEGDPDVLAGQVEEVALVELGDGVMVGHRDNGLRIGLVTPAWHPDSEILLIEAEADGHVKVATRGELGDPVVDTDEWPDGRHWLSADVAVSFGGDGVRPRPPTGARPRSGTRVSIVASVGIGATEVERAETDRAWALGWVRRLFGDRSRRGD
jgi:hypothetical protein